MKERKMDRAAIAAVILALLITAALFMWELIGLEPASGAPGYVQRLFDSSRVHSVEITIDDWQSFIASASEETYSPCMITIDGETFNNVGIRAKGNNSLNLTEEYGLARYSLKVEFDHYAPQSYHGLDKLSLDSLFQDNSYMKAFIAYDMMDYMGVPSPLASYVWVEVNGAPWGLFLAVEEMEEGFARRNFGLDHGEIYKPGYISIDGDNADLYLQYRGESPSLYPNIFNNAKFSVTESDKARLIEALETLSTGEDLESAVNVDQVLRYFAAQVFLMNWDSYLGPTGHNYILYEEDGIISMLPWDYNLAFGTYALGMTDPIRDPNVIINYPMNTPYEGQVMMERPLYHQLMKNNEYFQGYRAYMDGLIEGYFESGLFRERIEGVSEMIAQYVEADPTRWSSVQDHLLAVETLSEVCSLRAESLRGQINGEFPATLSAWHQSGYTMGVDASGVGLENLGDFKDLEECAQRQRQALEAVPKS